MSSYRIEIQRTVLFGLSLAATLTACSMRSLPVEAQVCNNPRPEICTAIYAPVCAFRVAKELSPATYASGCNACADPNVEGFIEGACPG